MRSWKLGKAENNDISSLLAGKTCKIVCGSKVPKDVTFLQRIFVKAIKLEYTDQNIWEAQFVVTRTQIYAANSFCVQCCSGKTTNHQNVGHNCFNILFRSFSSDITQAYLQSAEKLSRAT